MWLDERDWYIDKPLYKKFVWSENITAVCVFKIIDMHKLNNHNLFWMPKYKGDNDFSGRSERQYNNRIGLYDGFQHIEVE
jgi:hypothetical protein